jgi:hypothetical protein
MLRPGADVLASAEPDEASGPALADEPPPTSSTVAASALDILSATTMAKSPNVMIGSTVDLIDLQYVGWLGDGATRERGATGTAAD